MLGSGLAPEVVAVAERVCAERGARIVQAGTDPGVPVVGAAGRLPAPQLRAGAGGGGGLSGRARRWIAPWPRPRREVRVPGRLQQIDSDPLTVLDVAHNPEGMRALAESLPELARGRAPVVAVVSVLDDKDAAGMLAELMPACDRLVLTATQNPRVLPPATLQVAGRASSTDRRPRSSATRGGRWRGRGSWPARRARGGDRVAVSDRRSAGGAARRERASQPLTRA